MAPASAVTNINHLLLTTSEHGMSDHDTFMAACREFDEYLTEHEIKRPVVLLSDGHTSRYDFVILQFLLSKGIWLFISPPDKLNKNLHHEYRKAKDSMFSEMHSLNKEVFMLILSEIWDKWATKPVLLKAAKRVGITVTSLNVNFMQQDKFDRAENCIQQEVTPSTPVCSSSLQSTPESGIVSRTNKRKGSALYWKDKFDQAQSLIEEMGGKSIQLEEIPGFLTVKKVKPNLEKTSTRVTPVHGSMRAKYVASLVKDIKEQKEKKAKAKDDTNIDNGRGTG